MGLLPNDAEKIDVMGTNVDFFKYKKDGVIFYYFDTSLTAPPDPMVNARYGLELIRDTKDKLVMINHQQPVGLFPMIEEHFSYFIEDLVDGRVKIVFSAK